jgi:hypothetical protein
MDLRVREALSSIVAVRDMGDGAGDRIQDCRMLRARRVRSGITTTIALFCASISRTDSMVAECRKRKLAL